MVWLRIWVRLRTEPAGLFLAFSGSRLPRWRSGEQHPNPDLPASKVDSGRSPLTL